MHTLAVGHLQAAHRVIEAVATKAADVDPFWLLSFARPTGHYDGLPATRLVNRRERALSQAAQLISRSMKTPKSAFSLATRYSDVLGVWNEVGLPPFG